MQLNRTHRILIGLVIGGALIIAGIGFAGSYAAVRELALQKGFGTFSYFFPIGIDAGICVLLALDLLLTWLRIPFPLLRQTAWVLTAATIAFNGAAAWPDPLGVGMHAVIPVLFVVAVEAARHAVGRIADITADKHMEGVRITRWLLSPVPTFRLWRRMKLWELRSYEQVIKLEQERLIYQARLQARFGRGWRRKAPVEALMPLRLARYGVPLAETAPAGLAAAGIDPAVLPPEPQAQQQPMAVAQAQPAALPAQAQVPAQTQVPVPAQGQAPGQAPVGPVNHESPWFDASQVSPESYEGTYNPQIVEGLEPMPVPVPQGPEDVPPAGPEEFVEYPEYVEQPEPRNDEFEDVVYKVMGSYVIEHDEFPAEAELARLVAEQYGLPEFPETELDLLRQAVPAAQERVQQARAEMDTP
ncbi:membrane protein [Streptomyces vietnamensis]|uniref:Membrane protein n=2 Tax=Streptomyces vietnamensis TaxID=362257 RepID=A0A0B5IJI6_9ACTN|nr:membrane protein [Streptomyces vietnamensis]